MKKEDFGHIVRQIRQGQGITQEKLAEKAGLNPATVVLVERGISLPSLYTAVQLVEALGYELDLKETSNE